MEMWGKEIPDRDRGLPPHCKAPRLRARKEFIMGYLVLSLVGFLITKSNQKVRQWAQVGPEGMGSQQSVVGRARGKHEPDWCSELPTF